MKVLVACEESQAVCNAFREKGHEAYSCDIIECSGGHPEWHIMQDVLPLLNGNCTFQTCDGSDHTIDGRWDLIIAHPPCTYLSNAGSCRLYPKKGELNKDRFIKGLLGKEFFMYFWLYGWLGCGKIVIENPIPSKIFDLPKPTQAIQPYEYGHPYSKKTYLWEFGVDPLVPTDVLTEWTPFLPSDTCRKLGGASYGAKSCAHDGKSRAKTFHGIAKAMAEQWG